MPGFPIHSANIGCGFLQCWPARKTWRWSLARTAPSKPSSSVNKELENCASGTSGPRGVAVLWFLVCSKVITPALNSGNIDYVALYDRLGTSVGDILLK